METPNKAFFRVCLFAPKTGQIGIFFDKNSVQSLTFDVSWLRLSWFRF